MMMTLVEKMARADCEFRGWTWDALSAADKRQYKARNTAVLKAMREPSDVMESAGCNVVIGFSGEFSDYNEYLDERKLEEVWQAMIDAALKEAESG